MHITEYSLCTCKVIMKPKVLESHMLLPKQCTPFFKEKNGLIGQSVCIECVYRYMQVRRQRGFKGVHLNPPFGLQKILYTALTVHFKCPTVGKWSTTGTSSLAAVENHRCPSKSGCSYVGLFLEDQRLTRARKPFTALQ